MNTPIFSGLNTEKEAAFRAGGGAAKDRDSRDRLQSGPRGQHVTERCGTTHAEPELLSRSYPYSQVLVEMGNGCMVL